MIKAQSFPYNKPFVPFMDIAEAVQIKIVHDEQLTESERFWLTSLIESQITAMHNMGFYLTSIIEKDQT